MWPCPMYVHHCFPYKYSGLDGKLMGLVPELFIQYQDLADVFVCHGVLYKQHHGWPALSLGTDEPFIIPNA
jgi:hypothetical protein